MILPVQAARCHHSLRPTDTTLPLPHEKITQIVQFSLPALW
jgi:hypothetical protein